MRSQAERDLAYSCLELAIRIGNSDRLASEIIDRAKAYYAFAHGEDVVANQADDCIAAYSNVPSLAVSSDLLFIRNFIDQKLGERLGTCTSKSTGEH